MIIMGLPYPDSVSRVRPPNTTMPKTLAALPNNQYATDFDVVFGKLLDRGALSAVVPIVAFWIVAVFRRGWVDFHRIDRTIDDWGLGIGDAETAARIGELRQGPYTKRRRERRGAAVRSCGKAWKMEAMARCGVVCAVDESE